MAIRTPRWPALALVLASLSLGVGVVHAHAGYLRSEPGAGAVIATAPAQVAIWFAQDMFRRQGENWITVTGPAGMEVHAGVAAIDDDDRRLMRVGLQPDLAPGEYVVAWRTLSAEDGDTAEGTFSFTLDPAAQVTSTPMLAVTATATVPVPAATTPAGPTPTPVSAVGVGCGAALLPGLVVGMGFRRRRPR